jgi:thiol:disulfide interchange protein
MRARAKFLAVAATVAAAIGLGVGGTRLAHAYYSSTWYEDAAGYEEALREQRAHHVPIFVYFRVDWCPHCRAFDEMADAYDVRSKLNELIKVRINPDHGPTEKALQARYGSTSYPALFVQPDGGAPGSLSAKGPAARFVAQLPAQ